MRRGWIIVLLIVFGQLAVAQPRGPERPGPAPGPPPPPNAERREQIKKKIRTLRAYALTTELNLDEKTGSKLWPVLAHWDDEIDKLLQQRIDVQRRLHVADSIKDPRALDKLIDDAVANQKGFWSVEERRLVELRKILTPPQIARLLMVLPGFERKIQNQLRRAIQRPRGPPPPAIDDDDDDDAVEAELPRRHGRATPDDSPRR